MRRFLLLLGVSSVAAGAVVLACAAALRARAAAWQEAHADLFTGGDAAGAAATRLPGPARPVPGTPAVAPPSRRIHRGQPVARLRIERLGIDSVVAEGTDSRTLLEGPGHMQGTALPGEPDNCIIAGHRDGVFARLKGAREGDLVEVADEEGLKRYRVVDVRVVSRKDTTVLAPADRPLLTLITCYPFHHVGPAPRRLVVRGELVGETRPS